MWKSRSITFRRRLVVIWWLCALALSETVAATDTATMMRRRYLHDSDEEESVLCHLGMDEVMNQDGSHTEYFSCSLMVDQEYEEGTFVIDLPADTPGVDKELLLQGQQVWLEIRGASITDDEIILSPTSNVQAWHGEQRERRRLALTSTGTFRPVVIRISTVDASPFYSAETLYDYLFVADLSVKNQFARCSAGALTMEPDPLFGVIDVTVPTSVVGKSAPALTNLAEQQVNVNYSSLLNGKSIRQHADALMFVVPPGTGSWAAYAVVSGKASTYNDKFGGYLGALMHELAHNMGIRHAFHNGVEYQDRSGYMGSVPQTALYPERCFNAHNFRALSWYTDRYLAVQPQNPRLVKIAGFVDYYRTAPDEYIVVQVGDISLHYNRAVDFNKDSGEMRDQLVVVRERTDGTDLLSGLSELDSFTTPIYGVTATIQVCSVHPDAGAVVPHMLVSIGYGPSLCPAPPPPPPPPPPPAAPTPPVPTPPAPTPPVSLPCSSNPIRGISIPCVSQTVPLPPTSAPTRHPTPRPTPRPTPHPTSPPVVQIIPSPSPSLPLSTEDEDSDSKKDSKKKKKKSKKTVYAEGTSFPTLDTKFMEGTSFPTFGEGTAGETSLPPNSSSLNGSRAISGGILAISVSFVVLACGGCAVACRRFRIVWQEDEPDHDGEAFDTVLTPKDGYPEDRRTDIETLASDESALSWDTTGGRHSLTKGIPCQRGRRPGNERVQMRGYSVHPFTRHSPSEVEISTAVESFKHTNCSEAHQHHEEDETLANQTSASVDLSPGGDADLAGFFSYLFNSS